MTDEKEKIKTPPNIDATGQNESNSKTTEVDCDITTESFELNIEKLLKPISGEHPEGEDLRYEGTYDRIQEARREEDASLPQGVWEHELKKADWNIVQDICITALETRTKDLQIAVWLTESLCVLYGFKGLLNGVRLLIDLCEKYWDISYPKITEDDMEARIAPFVLLNEKVSLRLKFIKITKPRSVDSNPYTFADWESANILDKKARKDKTILTTAELEGKVTRTKLLGSVMFSSRSFYVDHVNDLNDAISILDSLSYFLENRCGKEAPSLKIFKDTLSDIQQLMHKFLTEKKKNELPSDSKVHEADSKDQSSIDVNDKESGTTRSFLSIRNRAEAYRMLSEAADYLMIHEPHSPAPYLVKRAVLWGHMTLTELLSELVSDENDLKQILKLLGVKAMKNN